MFCPCDQFHVRAPSQPANTSRAGGWQSLISSAWDLQIICSHCKTANCTTQPAEDSTQAGKMGKFFTSNCSISNKMGDYNTTVIICELHTNPGWFFCHLASSLPTKGQLVLSTAALCKSWALLSTFNGNYQNAVITYHKTMITSWSKWIWSPISCTQEHSHNPVPNSLEMLGKMRNTVRELQNLLELRLRVKGGGIGCDPPCPI